MPSTTAYSEHRNPTSSGGGDDPELQAQLAIMTAPFAPEQATEDIDRRLAAATYLAERAVHSESERRSIVAGISPESERDSETDPHVQKFLDDAEDFNILLSSTDGISEAEQDEVVSALAEDLITLWVGRTAAKYIPASPDKETSTEDASSSVKVERERIGQSEEPAIEFPAEMGVREVTRRLRRLGWVRRDGNGGHVRFQNENGRIVRFGINHGEILRASLKADLRHAGISAREFMSD
jgi:predicted RNA binding protein YcfA (HicA-like mRNA interferase family)